MRNHISKGTAISSYISLSRSWAVAWDYAVFAGSAQPLATQGNPGYIYEIDIPDPTPLGLTIIDPVREVARKLPSPMQGMTYKHEGRQEFLLGIVLPRQHGKVLTAPCPQPPHSGPGQGPFTGWGGIPSIPPTPSLDLTTMIYSLRDSEVLAHGQIPIFCVTARFAVWV